MSRLTEDDIRRSKEALRLQKEPPRARKRVGKKMFPIRYSSDYISSHRSPKTTVNPEMSRSAGLLQQQRSLARPLPVEDPRNAYLRYWANKAGSKHGVDQFHPVRISSSHKLYFHASEYFIEEVRLDGTVRRSEIYHNRDKCLMALDIGYIQWVD